MLVRPRNMTFLPKKFNEVAEAKLLHLSVEFLGQILPVIGPLILLNNSTAFPEFFINRLFKLFNQFIPKWQIQAHFVLFDWLHVLYYGLEFLHRHYFVANIFAFERVKNQELLRELFIEFLLLNQLQIKYTLEFIRTVIINVLHIVETFALE